jgi:two-component system, NarL family, response regulator DevR
MGVFRGGRADKLFRSYLKGGVMRKIADVYLLAENRLLREALIRLLSKKSELRIVGANAYSTSVQHEIIAARPHVVLLDSSGPAASRSNLIHNVRNAIRNLRIVMVDMNPDQEVFLDAVRAGVMGYVLKDASAVEVAAAIREVATGRAVCPPSLCMILFQHIMEQAPQQTIARASDLGLSRREQQMVELLRQRLTNKEIARRLNLSEQTVKNHVHRILRKTRAVNRSNIVEICQSKRLTDNPPEVSAADSA